MNPVIEIRTERPGDAAAVRSLNEKAFGQPSEAKIVDMLRERCPEAVSLVAILDDQIIGHILFSPAEIESQGKVIQGMGLAPMAVLPDYQRQGIGSRLVDAGLAALRQGPCPFVIVLGHPDYYPRFGFVPASSFGFRCQWDQVPDNAFMISILDTAAMKGVSGTVRYRDEFDEAM